MRLSDYTAWFSLLIAAGVIVLSLTLLGGLSGHSPEDHAHQMRDAIERAAVQCYALEGAYPPDIQYLENYGIYIDETLLFVDYRPVAANLRPEIYVAPIAGPADAEEFSSVGGDPANASPDSVTDLWEEIP